MRTCAVAVALLAASAFAGDGKDPETLLRLLPKSRLTLLEGIRQAERTHGPALSAKFELDHEGALALSVYTTGRGLEGDAEHAVLQELLGSPTGEAWTPRVEVFADAPHVARSAQQQTLMALSPLSLAEIAERAQKSGGGTLLSVTPVLRGRRGLFVARTVRDGAVVEQTADLLTGVFAPAAASEGPVRIPVERHADVRRGAWVVEFGCAGAQDGAGFVYFRLKEKGFAVGRVVIVNGKGATMEAGGPKADRGGWYEVNAGEAFGDPTEILVYPATAR